MSLIYRLLRCLLGLLVVLLRSDLSKEVELLVLRLENQVLRRQVRGTCRQRDHLDPLWLAALSRLVHRRLWAGIFPVAPATILRWHRRLGRPEVDLHRSTPTGTAVDRCFGQDADCSDVAGEPDVGASKNPG